jgi:hypothetical protein
MFLLRKKNKLVVGLTVGGTIRCVRWPSALVVWGRTNGVVWGREIWGEMDFGGLGLSGKLFDAGNLFIFL